MEDGIGSSWCDSVTMLLLSFGILECLTCSPDGVQLFSSLASSPSPAYPVRLYRTTANWRCDMVHSHQTRTHMNNQAASACGSLAGHVHFLVLMRHEEDPLLLEPVPDITHCTPYSLSLLRRRHMHLTLLVSSPGETQFPWHGHIGKLFPPPQLRGEVPFSSDLRSCVAWR